MPTRAVIALGSNMGDRLGHLEGAISELGSIGDVVAVSSVWETAPIGGPPQADYLNAVALVDTELSARAVLDRLLAIEQRHGRVRRGRWGPRPLDLDLVLHGDAVLSQPGLVVPHPSLAERRFVLEPLIEVWPDATLPDGTEVAGLLPDVTEQIARRFAAPTPPGKPGPYRASQPADPRSDMAGNVVVIDHPLVQHKLTLMRRRETSSADFRKLLREISALMGYEVTRDLPLTTAEIETPLAPMEAPIIAGLKPVIVSILRAGGGILEGMLDVLPAARVGHIGLYRDHETLEAIEYYFKMPERVEDRLVIAVDPMLATGHSAVAAVSRIKGRGPREVRFVCLLAAPEGIEEMGSHHPDVTVYTAAIDSHLDEKGYIVPGLGDAGDRIFGTK